MTSGRVVTILALSIAGFALTRHLAQPRAPKIPPRSRQAQSAAPHVMDKISIRSGDTLDALLKRSGLAHDTRAELIEAVGEHFDVRTFRAGSQLTLLRSEGALVSVEYVVDPDHRLEIVQANGQFKARIAAIPGAVRPRAVCGTLKGSLFESMARAGEQPELALRMAEIFAWDIDFYRDPQPDDQFCLLVEKKEYDNGAPATYRRVLAATYVNAGIVHDAYLFKASDGEEHYYSGDGQSLEAAFLRSPLKLDARISSHFSGRRLHPVLGVYRPHLGTDYAAPVGTPVQAVADGRVVYSGLSGGSGNLVTLQHANGYVTQYLHLSRRLVRKGDRVKQGQRIGLVGMTGLASGPHVDIRIQNNGRYLNWATLKLPRQSRVPASSLREFEMVRDRLMAMMVGNSGESKTELASGTTESMTAR